MIYAISITHTTGNEEHQKQTNQYVHKPRAAFASTMLRSRTSPHSKLPLRQSPPTAKRRQHDKKQGRKLVAAIALSLIVSILCAWMVVFHSLTPTSAGNGGGAVVGVQSLFQRDTTVQRRTEHSLAKVVDSVSQKNDKDRVKRQDQHHHFIDTNTPHPHNPQQPSLARGVAGRPMAETPALVGARRGHIQCDNRVDDLAYWNDPQGRRDQTFVSPFVVPEQEEKYLSFNPDPGGWNNIRMSLENILVLAAVTNRTLVLPPKHEMYLLDGEKGNKHRGFADFFPITSSKFQKKVRSITTREFLERAKADARFPIPTKANRTRLYSVADKCIYRRKDELSCMFLYDWLATVGQNPHIVDRSCVIFDKETYQTGRVSDLARQTSSVVCNHSSRVTMYFTRDMAEPALLHFPSDEYATRIMAHFYNVLHFTNPAVDHYFKRFVRDYIHYVDPIFCAAGKIFNKLRQEGLDRGFELDNEGGGSYSSFHVRRGDLQFKEVKIPGQEWYENTKEILIPGEVLYVATDERNKTFFDPLAKHYELRFLDDYWDVGGLGSIDPNYFGMIDSIIASRGRTFTGTWFSTFTGYILRLRGYAGLSMKNSWYSYLPRKNRTHSWDVTAEAKFATEWPEGWAGIDADVFPSRDVF